MSKHRGKGNNILWLLHLLFNVNNTP